MNVKSDHRSKFSNLSNWKEGYHLMKVDNQISSLEALIFFRLLLSSSFLSIF